MLGKNIFSSWESSLEFFRPSNLKLFLLISLKTYFRSLIFLLRYFCPLIFFVLVLYIFNYFDSIFLYLFLYFILFFIFLIILRPSLGNKNFSYFTCYLQRIVGFVLVNFLILLLFLICPLASKYLDFLLYFKVPYFLFLTLIIPVAIVASLLFLETTQSIENIYFSIIRAFKMSLYFYPTFLILGLVGLGLCFLANGCLSILNLLNLPSNLNFFDFFYIGLFFKSVKFIIFGLVGLFFLSVMTTYYLKIKHTNYKLLF